MYVEEGHQAKNVIPFRKPRPAPETMGSRREAEDALVEPSVPSAMVLNAERGIINTGTVHGGQHVTTVELADRPERGADGAI
ncbi:S-type pyocin domain-containing protein [Streptomyces sp. VNUA116]|uniref:S-type pyocin domain-containing protein n=1 Tax=Streptomyces sp. VNUA116 TaxID=3062449 RepID=UPI0026747E73|nr:S-type pyocin domain-containing protein [Streptomyces sp. VNUA116]WKU43871.1 S-type pyocin domain-containing protein [Streptomyces sp. VNUA116]